MGFCELPLPWGICSAVGTSLLHHNCINALPHSQDTHVWASLLLKVVLKFQMMPADRFRHHLIAQAISKRSKRLCTKVEATPEKKPNLH